MAKCLSVIEGKFAPPTFDAIQELQFDQSLFVVPKISMIPFEDVKLSLPAQLDAARVPPDSEEIPATFQTENVAEEEKYVAIVYPVRDINLDRMYAAISRL